MPPQDSQLRKGVIELAVVALLAREPTYGADLVDRLSAYPGLDVSSGTLYPLLTRLRKGGYVTTTWRESPVGPPRKIYELTAAGHRRLATLTDAWTLVSTAIADVLKETP
ncbi:MAG: PadR family transcriptional regulator [Bowdeniella nasicola]|nr:PadR family transcriptional regulator [Bowdeniella nasicola]